MADVFGPRLIKIPSKNSERGRLIETVLYEVKYLTSIAARGKIWVSA